MPSNLFFGTGIPAAILVFRRDKKDDTVLFIDASREFQDGKNQNRLRPEDVAKIAQTYRERQADDKYAHLATLDEIRTNDYNLNIPRYVDTFEEEAEIDLQAVQGVIDTLEQTLTETKGKLQGYLDELGLS